MRRMITTAALLLGLSATAHASEKEAQECVRSSTWDLYGEGWNVRTMKAATLPEDGRDFFAFRVNLFPGNEYLLVSCADGGATSIVAAVYPKVGAEVDEQGNPKPIITSEDGSRTPRLTFTPAEAGEYIIVVKTTGMAEANAGVATAVTYR